MHLLAEGLVSLLIDKGAASQDRKAVYIYGCELLLSTAFSITSILIIGVLTRHLCQAVVFLLFFMPIRTVSNGYHASSYAKCFMLTNLIASICIFAAELTGKQISSKIMWCLYVFSHIFIWIRGPYQSKKQLIKIARIEKNKKSMHEIQIIELAIAVYITIFSQIEILYTLVLTTCIVAAMILIAELTS